MAEGILVAHHLSLPTDVIRRPTRMWIGFEAIMAGDDDGESSDGGLSADNLVTTGVADADGRYRAAVASTTAAMPPPARPSSA